MSLEELAKLLQIWHDKCAIYKKAKKIYTVASEECDRLEENGGDAVDEFGLMCTARDAAYKAENIFRDAAVQRVREELSIVDSSHVI